MVNVGSYMVNIYGFMGFHGHGATSNWLVYFIENPTKVDDDWGYPYLRNPPYGNS